MLAALANIFAFARWVYLTAIFAFAMNYVQPAQNHDELAGLTAYAVIEDPLFDDDVIDVTPGAIATITSGEAEESSLRIDAIGDHGRSCGALQKWDGCRLSRLAALEAGIDQIRLSFAMSKTCPWCGFLAGPRGIESPHVRRMSKHRERLTVRILAALAGADLSTAEARR